MYPHKIVYGFKPRQAIDLIYMADHYRVFEFTYAFASHVHKLHKKINDEIEQSNVNYKLRADIRKKFKTFNVGDYMMVHVCQKQFFRRTVKKLHARTVGPFKILNKLNDDML